MNETKIKIRVGRLGSLLRGLQGIDSLGVKDNKVIIDVAGNLVKVQNAIDVYLAREEQIKRDVVDKAQVNLATPNQQARLTPEAEIRSQVVAMSNEQVELDLVKIDAPALFEGEAKPQPGMVAALMPVLSNLEEVPLTESLQ